ncbi:fumarylacetoacetate hydrolase family protein [bacterium]|nr:fumarylacetoacetate hydrolase family protein [bacterium]
MKLFSFSAEDEKVGVGVEASNGVFNLTRALDIYQKAKGVRQPVSFDFLQMLVEMGYCSGAFIRDVLSESWVQSKYAELRMDSGYKYDLPIARPSKIICLGSNYREHAKELQTDVPKEPLFFAKAPSALIHHEADIVIPRWLNDRVDHEAELAVVIGKEGKDILQDDAMSHVAGYTILNDVTARAMQKEDIDQRHPWFRSKSLDTFCPLGPFIVPADECNDPYALEIRLTVNGKERQRENTSSMIFSIPNVIASISRFMTLQPGDIIATGTPSGVSPIEDGDLIEISITELGLLRNRVVKEV